jgi:hypothetical protein
MEIQFGNFGEDNAGECLAYFVIKARVLLQLGDLGVHELQQNHISPELGCPHQRNLLLLVPNFLEIHSLAAKDIDSALDCDQLLGNHIFQRFLCLLQDRYY